MMELNQDNYHRLDFAFADFLTGLSHHPNHNGKEQLKKLILCLSHRLNQGHTCLLVDEPQKELLLLSGLAMAASETGVLPLIIEDDRLYLHRYWLYETHLAERITTLCREHHEYPQEQMNSLINKYFNQQDPGRDRQKEALNQATRQGLCIITGGPGTGKTTLICNILALLQELTPEPLTIALTAPTGKAAMRLQEAVNSAIGQLPCPENIKNRIPRTATTLHRLLGSQSPSPYFRHHAGHPLTFDAVVVDEASMVDLALMSKLADALKPRARLILLGDKDQLISVESGSVLADLMTALPEHTVELAHSYRFDHGIQTLAGTVNRQDGVAAWEALVAGNQSLSRLAHSNLINYAVKQRQDYLNSVKNGGGIMPIFETFNRFQILCANRFGPHGAVAINQALEQKLFNQGLNSQLHNWYPGRPVIILQNNPILGLFNGDIGICLVDPETDNRVMVYFQRPDGSFKKFPPSRLPACETVFALTIHKSQGSEYDELLIVLPEQVNPVLSKELLYTAITRAKRSVKIAAEKEIFIAAVSQKIVRHTGLADKLRKKQ